MKIKLITSISILFFFTGAFAQTDMPNSKKLPYYEIPAYPENYTTGSVLARLVDGLGYRFYWATEGLRTEDIDYRPSEDAASVAETLDHLYGLSTTIKNATMSAPNIRPLEIPEVTYEEKRVLVLRNLLDAANQLRGASEEQVSKMQLIFKRGEQESSFPFWNNINGPITDAIYHTGQIVSFRRTTGNPINSNVNVFIGKTRE